MSCARVGVAPTLIRGAIILCPLHRRVSDGVCVRNHANLVRWCYYCKKVHDISEFARGQAAYGKASKILACCIRGCVMTPSTTAREFLGADGMFARRGAMRDAPVTSFRTRLEFPIISPHTRRVQFVGDALHATAIDDEWITRCRGVRLAARRSFALRGRSHV